MFVSILPSVDDNGEQKVSDFEKTVANKKGTKVGIRGFDFATKKI